MMGFNFRKIYCFIHVPLVVYAASFCRTHLHVFSSSVKRLSRTHWLEDWYCIAVQPFFFLCFLTLLFFCFSILCFPLALCPASVIFSKPPSLIVCPRKFSCLSKKFSSDIWFVVCCEDREGRRVKPFTWIIRQKKKK